MAQVILKQNMFVGYRIKKSPNRNTPVYVPDEFMKDLPLDSVVVVDKSEAVEVEKEDLTGYVLRDLDELRIDDEIAQNRLEEVSVSRITANAQAMMDRANLSADDLEGTGKGGRVTQKDVQNYIENRG
jgi:hypothetical protein